MFSSTTLVCIVDLMCIVDHMCLLACNVCGGITAVAFSCCGILHLTLCGSTSGPAWYPSCPVISGKLPSSGLLHYLWFISVCVGHLSAVFTPSRHCFYSTESIFYFFAACPIYPAKVSHYYRPTSVDTASVHIVKGITKNIHNGHEPLRHSPLGLGLGLGSTAACTRTHHFPRGEFFLLARSSADVHFCRGVCCWSCWRKLLLKVYIESTRLILGLD